MGDAPRDSKGRVGAGNNLRGTARRVRAKVISRRLAAEFVRRYANEPIGDTGEVLGPERARLKHLFVLMDIMESPAEKSQDRIKAAEKLDDRLNGKPVDQVELSGTVETGGPLDKAVAGMSAEQLLELVRAARGH